MLKRTAFYAVIAFLLLIGLATAAIRFQGNNVLTDGNFTGGNIFIPSYSFHHSNVTIPVTVNGQWENVSFVDDTEELEIGIINDNITFAVDTGGVYFVTYTMLFQDSAGSPTSHVTTRVLNNNNEISGSSVEIDPSKQNSEMEAHNAFMVTLSDNAELIFQFAGDDTTVSLLGHSTFGEHYSTLVVTIRRIA